MIRCERHLHDGNIRCRKQEHHGHEDAVIPAALHVSRVWQPGLFEQLRTRRGQGAVRKRPASLISGPGERTSQTLAATAGLPGAGYEYEYVSGGNP